MAILVSAEVPGQTREGYETTVEALASGLKEAPGFVLHMSAPSDDGWTVIEVWESKKEANDWFAHNVAPALPPGITPRRTFTELHTVITGQRP